MSAQCGTHSFVAFLAYCLHVTLRARLKPLAPGLTPRAVLDKLAAVQMLDVHFPTTDGRTLILSRYTELNADQKLLALNSSSACHSNRPLASPHHKCRFASQPIQCSVDLRGASADSSQLFPPVGKVGLTL